MKTLFSSESQVEGYSQKTIPPLFTILDDWQFIVVQLKKQMESAVFEHYVAALEVIETGTHELTLFAPNEEVYNGLLGVYMQEIYQCKEQLGLNYLMTKLELKSGVEQNSSVSSNEKSNTEFPDERREDESESKHPIFSSTLARIPRLNPHYTFETFVRGPSNQFALASCQNVAENPGQNYNPLFLYGSTGLGKTHLLHAVGNQVCRLNPQHIVAYISSEQFMNEMIYCIRHNKMWDFRQKYRNCDVFMMDDIQFISGNKAATQEEFFHTFNTLYEAKKQIIITSDLFPQDIPDIEERLRNRFQWGLIADIQPPDMEHRIAILMNKAETLKVHLSPEVAEYIANHAKRNIRELEGALHRIAAFAALHGRPLDRAIAMETFHSMLGEAQPKVKIDSVQKAVAEHFKIRVSDLKSKKRQRALTLPRQIAMYLARQLTQSSYPEIGEKFGGKDHTTVMHAVKKISQERLEDLDLKAHLESLERFLEKN